MNAVYANNVFRSKVFYLLTCAVCAVFLFTGCGPKTLPPHQQAIAVADQLTYGYEAAEAEYFRLYRHISPEFDSFLESNVAPLLDGARMAIIALRDVSAAYARTMIKPGEYEVKLAQAKLAILSATKAITTLSKGFKR